MALSTNFSVSPYFDDYDESKSFYRVLFKPAFAVQARELTQLQTILQNQIERFGNSIYQNGSIVDGCPISFREGLPFVRLQDKFSGNNTFIDVSTFNNCIIESTITGLRALVLTYNTGSEVNYPSTNRLYYQYLNSGSNSGVEYKTFSNNEVLRVYSSPRTANVFGNTAGGVPITTYANSTANTLTVSQAFGVSVGEGIIYQKGFFVKVSPSTAVVNDDASLIGNSVVGFTTTESIVNSDQDTSILDNALGYRNENAPGADRLKLVSTLTTLTEAQASNTSNFTPIVTFNNGNPVIKQTDSDYSRLGDELARARNETNGGYVVKPFSVDTERHTANSSYLIAKVSPGIGYALGHRIELIKTAGVDVRRGTNTAAGLTQLVTTNFGSFIYITEAAGTFDFSAMETVKIYDATSSALTNRNFSIGAPSGSQVGTATVRSYSYVSGTPGTPSAVLAVYLFNIVMNSGKSFGSDAKALYFDGATKGIGDIQLTGGAAILRNSERRKLIWGFGKKGLRRLTNASGVVNTQYVARAKTTGTLATTGLISITLAAAHAGGSDKFPYGTGVLGDGNETDFVIVLTSNTQTANLAGSALANTSTANLNGTSTTFTSMVSPGEYLRIGGTDTRRVVSVPNNTQVILDSAPTTANASANVAKIYPAGYVVPIVDTMVGTRTINITANNAATINIGSGVVGALTGTATVAVYHDVLRFGTVVPARKNINKSRWVKIDTANNAANNVGPWILGFPDVHKIRGVYVSGSYSNSATDMTSSFYLDHGMKDTHYDTAKLFLKPGQSITAAQKMFVCLDHFTSNTTSGVGFYSIDSYPIDDANTANSAAITTAEIPVYLGETGETFALRDSVDFRPFMTATANSVANGDPANTSITINPVALTTFVSDAGGNYIPSPDQTFQSDIEYYLGRKDMIYFTTAGILKVKEGNPSEYPIAPEEPNDGMPVAVLNIKPYPSLTSAEQSALLAENRKVKNTSRDTSYATQVSIATNRRYTMRDVGVLDTRISNLEYYMSLSLLEKAATDLQISDTNGLDRFKNGIFVDPFTSHINGEVTNPEYKISIDSKKGLARPYFSQEPIEVEVETLTNTQQTARIVTLPYTSVNYITQSRASKLRNAAPVAFQWAGNATLYPNYNHNIDKTQDAAVQVTVDLSQTWSDFANSPWGTSYGDWRTTTSSTASTVEFTGGSTTTVTSTSTIDRDIQKLNVDLTQTSYNLGNYVTDISIQPYIAGVEIAFSARAMRPSTKVYAFFDDVNVSQYCAGGTANGSITNTSDDRIVQRTAAWGTQLTTDANGNIFGKFLIPGGTFRVGERRFRLADVTSLATGENAITTSASATFVASNFASTSQGITLTTITPELSVSSTRETSTTTTTNTTTNLTPQPVFTWQVPPVEPSTPPPLQEPQPFIWPPLEWQGGEGGFNDGSDPVAQAFRVEVPAGVAGVFITGIDLYFQKKSADSRSGISVMICEMLNGYPNTTRILPFSTKWLPASSVNVSETALNATTFTFEAPVYLANDIEYAFIVKPDGGDPDYILWIAELGATDISTNQQIFSMPYCTTMFLSASFTTWTALQTEYIKFNMKRAAFSQTSGTVLFRNESDDFFTLGTLTYANSTTSIRTGDMVYQQINGTPGNVNTSINGQTQLFASSNGFIQINASTGNFTAGQTLQIHRPATPGGSTNSTTLMASANLVSINNIRTNAVVPRFATITPPGTKLKYEYQGTSNTYTKDSAWTTVLPDTETEMFDYERIAVSKSNEVASMAGVKSLNIQATLTSDTTYLSPVVDLVRSNILCVGNYIDPTTANTFLEYGNAGGVQTKYLSKPIVLAAGNDAEDLKVYITAYRPAGSDVLVFAKLLSGDDPSAISDKSWTLMNIDNSSVYSDYRDLSNYIEYSYSMPNTAPNGTSVVNYQNNIIPTTTAYLGANSVIYKDSTGANFARFKTFQIKVVLLSDTTARVPRLNDVRAIALQY